MAKKGRPISDEEIIEIHVHLRLKKNSDADIISFFQNIPSGLGATRLKNALRAGGLGFFDKATEEIEDDSFAEDLQLLTF